MDPLKIILKYYKKDSKLYNILVEHSMAVSKKALEIARSCKKLNPDLKFIKEAALLHDIGIFLTNSPKIGCFGERPYICHGYFGREILEKEGYKKHALVCERHVGLGLSINDIISQRLPLPKRDMLPVSIEEEIICLADKFFSKKERHLGEEISLNKIKDEIQVFGDDKLARFEILLKKFGY
jgi:uncharacterized protein